MKSRMDVIKVDGARSSCGKGRDVRNMIYISNSFNSFIVERFACPQIWRVLWGVLLYKIGGGSMRVVKGWIKMNIRE